ncbi:lytic transglycosylase [Aphanothece sacrum FPU1]|uniref:Lytic transglycosylase n=1 Tax=Aphanothece sacrum FPU1 TaxID=1920663 RepID=A0A401IFQ4_APHSA|nr:lytic transglycosylase [Aphanothece sacrum FPU1]GBF86035.1 lytic transglycosylase [Aphanothece sacrum FPU3]
MSGEPSVYEIVLIKKRSPLIKKRSLNFLNNLIYSDNIVGNFDISSQDDKDDIEW